ncbi:hypothetical protein OTU49_007768, partial [Cherax quadricarinatus]
RRVVRLFQLLLCYLPASPPHYHHQGSADNCAIIILPPVTSLLHMEFDDEFYLEEDKLPETRITSGSPVWEKREDSKEGMTITSGSVTLEKNDSNLIGISIGGGAKYCPCLYVVQVFDNTAASREGTLQSGDEITGVNGVNVKGKSKQEVAHLIQRSEGSVSIQYNKLHADPKQGKTLDIAMKKVKHRLVENLSSSTADALGLSRAILCNDSLVKKLDDLQRTEEMYQALMDHTKRLLKAFFDLAIVYRSLEISFVRLVFVKFNKVPMKPSTSLGRLTARWRSMALIC